MTVCKQKGIQVIEYAAQLNLTFKARDEQEAQEILHDAKLALSGEIHSPRFIWRLESVEASDLERL